MKKFRLLVSCGLIISILSGCNKMQPEDILNNQVQELSAIHEISFRDMGLMLNNKGAVARLTVPVCNSGKVRTDYVKFISSICTHEDKDYSIANYSIVESNPAVKLSEQFKLKDFEQPNPETLISPTDWVIEKDTKVLHINSRYLAALKSLEEFSDLEFVSSDKLPIVDDFLDKDKLLKGIPISKKIDGFKYTYVKPGDGIDSTSTLLKDGSVVSQRVVRSFQDVVDCYVTAIRSITGEEFDKYYKSMENDSMGTLLGYCGNYTLAVKSINFNTQELYIGYGEQARLNIIMELNDRVLK